MSNPHPLPTESDSAALPLRTPPVRRTHSKSRYGCTQCKSRKLKCDEVKPRCKNCTKRDLPCSLEAGGSSMIFLPGIKSKSPAPPSSAPSPSAGPSSTVPRSAGTASPGSDYLNLQPQALENPFQRRPSPTESHSALNTVISPMSPTFTVAEREQMNLIHHFTRSTWKVLPGGTSREERSALWLDHIFSLGKTNDFVLHSILAVTALHLALTEVGTPFTGHYQAQALHHHTAALALSRHHFDSVIPDMVPSLFAFSILMSVYAFGQPKIAAQVIQPIPAIQQILGLLRGCGIVARSNEKVLETGPIACLRLPRPQESRVPLAPDLQRALGALASRNAATTTDADMKENYEIAISVLWYTFVLIQESPEMQMTTVPFDIVVPVDVLNKMREQEPMALLILAHYAVMLHYLDGSPWMEGWGRWVVDAVDQQAGQDWREDLSWAKAEVRRAGKKPVYHFEEFER